MPKQQNTIQEEAMRRYDALPDELKQAMSSIASAETIYGIGKKFALNVEETGNLASLIGYTILGMAPIAKLTDSIKDVTGADNAKAAEIASEVNAKIFAAIREQLKKTHGEKWDERALGRETRDRRQETGLEPMKPTAPVAPAPAAPTAPKSPWEIRPDGMRRETGDKRQDTWGKSVVPPVSQLTTNNLQPTTKTAEAEVKQETRDKRQEITPPEPPKTREAPQPVPAPRAPEVLKEIRPLQPTTYNQQPTITQKPEMPKAAPPAGLPFMKEVGKLTQTPELQKLMIDNVSPIISTGKSEAPQPPQPAPAPKPEAGIMNKELGIRETVKTDQPQAPQPVPAPKPQAPLQAPASMPTQKYAADPYREPIE